MNLLMEIFLKSGQLVRWL